MAQIKFQALGSRLVAVSAEEDPDSVEEGSRSTSPLASLRFIPLKSIVGQEGIDPRRAERVADEIKSEGYLRHPVYVTQFASDLFTSFDGHNRINAFHKLEYSAILAQLIRLEDIVAGTWIQILDAETEHLLEALRTIGFYVEQISSSQINVRSEDLVATVISHSSCFSVRNAKPLEVIKDTGRVTKALTKITRHRIERFADADLPSVLKSLGSRLAIKFPTFTPQQIVEAIRRGEQVGAGVTRWEFRGRILNTNLPVGTWLNQPVDELNAKLKAAIASGTIRPYYSTVVEAEVKWNGYL